MLEERSELAEDIRECLEEIIGHISTHTHVIAEPVDRTRLLEFSVFCEQIRQTDLTRYNENILFPFSKDLRSLVELIRRFYDTRVAFPKNEKPSIFNLISLLLVTYSPLIVVQNVLVQDYLFQAQSNIDNLYQKARGTENNLIEVYQRTDQVYNDAVQLRTKIKAIADDLGIARYHTLFDDEA